MMASSDDAARNGVEEQVQSATVTHPSTSVSAMPGSSSIQALDDPATASTPPEEPLQPSKRSMRWPAYFFPALATQRMSFCLDVLKREDIKSVCEFGCGQGAVLRPMTNGATHIDSFPEAIFDESLLLAEEAEEEETEGQVEAGLSINLKDGYSKASIEVDNNHDDDDEHSLAPSESASRRHSLEVEGEVSSVIAEVDNATSDSRGRSPPRGRQGGGGSSLSPARRSARTSTPEPIPSTSNVKLNTEILDKYKRLPGPRVQDKELHLRRIAGLDITEDSLLEAIEATAPPPEQPSPFFTYFSYSNRDRWEDLRVELWQGSLDVYNDALDNFEAFIMTEVIEHLYQRQLEKFPEILFGSYRPRIIVITTPNYDFNQYFGKAKQSSAEDVAKEYTGERTEDETKNSFKDPTGRTERYFRDEDHKFEWTEKEFKDWCGMITSKYDYTVEYSGVGSLRNYFGKSGMHSLSENDPFDSSSSSKVPPRHIQEMLDSVPDPSKMFATQTAVFRRKFAYESERSPRSPIQMPLAFYGVKPVSKRPLSSSHSPSSAPGSSLGAAASTTTARKSAKQRSNAADPESSSSASRSPDQRHKLLKAHYFKACPQAGNAKSSKAIRHLLDDLLRNRMRARSVSLRELWGRNEIAQACGGYINKLIQALVRDSTCSWDIYFDPTVLDKGGEVEDAVQIILKDFEEPGRPSVMALEDAEDAGEDVRDPFVKNSDDEDEGDDEDDDQDISKREKSEGKTQNNGSDGQVIPQLSKKQRKIKRMEEAPFLAPIFPLEHEPVWMPQKGSEDAQGWEEWTDPARASTMITEQEWAEESDKKHASGWD